MRVLVAVSASDAARRCRKRACKWVGESACKTRALPAESRLARQQALAVLCLQRLVMHVGVVLAPAGTRQGMRQDTDGVASHTGTHGAGIHDTVRKARACSTAAGDAQQHAR